MSPWPIAFVAIGIFMIALALRGNPDNIIAALKGKPYGSSTLE